MERKLAAKAWNIIYNCCHYAPVASDPEISYILLDLNNNNVGKYKNTHPLEILLNIYLVFSRLSTVIFRYSEIFGLCLKFESNTFESKILFLTAVWVLFLGHLLQTPIRWVRICEPSIAKSPGFKRTSHIPDKNSRLLQHWFRSTINNYLIFNALGHSLSSSSNNYVYPTTER